jgi:hypothetical protein
MERETKWSSPVPEVQKLQLFLSLVLHLRLAGVSVEQKEGLRLVRPDVIEIVEEIGAEKRRGDEHQSAAPEVPEVLRKKSLEVRG